MRNPTRSLLITVVVILFLAPLVAAHAQAGVTVTAQVQASLREGPSRQTKIVGGMPENASAPALARSQDNAWVQANYNGITGWIAVRQVTVHGDLNTLPVSAAAGGAAPSSAQTAPVRSANTRTLTLTERRVFRWLSYVDPNITSATVQNGQLVVVENGSVDSIKKVITDYFNVAVVDGKIVATLTTLSFDNATHPASDFQPEGINKINQLVSDGLNGLFQAWEGVRTVVSVTLDPGQLVIIYAR